MVGESLWRRIRSFRRPEQPEVADIPEVGDSAPEQPRLGQGRRRVLLFLRHVGCAFGEAMLTDLRDAARRRSDIDFIAVTHGDADQATDWCRKLGIKRIRVTPVGSDESLQWCQGKQSNLRVLVDPDRQVYAMWGLGLGGADHLLDPRVLYSLCKVHLRGSRDRDSSGTRWQRSGMFAVDSDDEVRFVHTADRAGDMPDIDAAVAEFDSGSSGAASRFVDASGDTPSARSAVRRIDPNEEWGASAADFD